TIGRPMVLITEQGMIHYLNQSSCKLLGGQKQDLIGDQLCHFLNFLSEQTPPEIFQRIKSIPGIHKVKVIVSNLRGEQHAYETSFSKDFESNLILANFIPALMEENQENPTKKEQQLEAQLDEAKKGLRELFHSIDHDLKAPLRAINSFSDILRSQYSHQLDSQGQELLEMIIGNSGKMKSLIDDMLTYAKIAEQDRYFMELDLQYIFKKQFEDQIFMNHKDKPVEIEVFELSPIQGDPNLVGILVYHLVSNALKFTDKVETAKISVGQKIINGKNTYYIQDNGIGMRQQDEEKAFKLFKRMVRHDDYPGNGVGLPMVKKAVEVHQGKVWIESEPDKGTTVFLQFPS
ncbi:MAG: ATP-binding protein, partial [Bacteroidota bacterium]